MKKIFTILFTVLSCAVMAQKPIQTLGNKFNRVKVLGEFSADSAIVLPKDTIKLQSTDRGIAFKGTNMYRWDGERWGLITASGGVQGSILNDSTFLLCNSNGCDTFHVQNISISSFSFTSDSTVQVCNTVGSCTTIAFNPIPLSKFYVDSAKIIPGAVDTLVYYINGTRYIGGYVNHLSPLQDGFITRGTVTWSGLGLTYNITGSHYVKNGTEYYSRDTSITLNPADATYPRTDLFAVDTLSRTVKVTGTPSPSATAPQVDPLSELALTTGITLGVGDTIPDVTVTAIYNENLGSPDEWVTSGSAGYNNTASPYNGTKAALINYTKNAQYTFTGTNQTVAGQIFSVWVKLISPLSSKTNLNFNFYNGSTLASSLSIHNTFGLDPNLTGVYQQIAFPLTAATWSGQIFNKIVLSPTGSGSLYLDYAQLQSGLQNIPDNSNKVDSTTISNGYEFWWSNGVPHVAGQVVSLGKIDSLISDSIALKLNITDTLVFSRYSNTYLIRQTDSIAAQLRSEIVSAAGGGVISFNSRTGAIIPDSSDYRPFFYTRWQTDSLLALKSDFSGDYNDLTNKPVTVTNLSLGVVTSTSQAIDNSNGTGVVLPSASITAAGLMTAGDKVLVNTIPGKVNISDTAAMLAPYLRVVNAFTKSQADLLYRPISYVPTWTSITGKPTFATVATTGSYNDLINKPTIPAAQIQSDWNQTNNTLLDYIKNKPTIPTNNNQLTNGAGYITGIDSINVSLLSGDTIDRKHLPPDTTVIKHEGAGIWTAYASENDTIHVKNLQAGTGVTITPNADSSLTISATGGGTGTVSSVTGNPTNLVDNTDPANPVIQQDASKLDKSDSTIANRVTANTTAIAGKQNTLTLTTTGTSGAATLIGPTLNIPQYTGGSGTVTSVGLTMADVIYNSSVTGSPITSSGTLTPTLKSQSVYTLFGNNTGSSATPTFFTNKFADSLKRSTDSVFRRVNSVWIFQYKDSTGGSALPSMTGNAGKLLTTDGTTASWGTAIPGIWSVNGLNLYYNAGKVGINTSSPSNFLDINYNSTSALDSGLLLENNITATSGSQSQYSPALMIQGSSWTTAAGGSANTYRYKFYGKNTGGTGGSDFVLTVSKNGGSYLDLATFHNFGGVDIPNACTFGNITGSTIAGSLFIASAAGFGGFTSTLVGFSHAPNINVSTGTGIIQGFAFKPTLTNITGTTDIIGFANTFGNNYFNSSGYGTAIGASSIPANTIFKVTSTTKVSHPFPNMTAAQKTALTGMEPGDHIYQTDGTEGVYVYKSDSAWHFAY